MSFQTTLLTSAFGLAASLLPCSPALAGENAASKRAPARVYTNEDLDRVHPFSEETGVRSVPAVADAGRRAPSKSEDDHPRSRGETYWRAEARRMRERIAVLAAQADELRARFAAEEDERGHVARSSRSSRSRASLSGGADAVGKARLAAMALRIRALEDDLAERARRDGALPGWLR